jgi:hypothetical protein
MVPYVAVRESLHGPQRRFAAVQDDARNEGEADSRQTQPAPPD